MKIPLIIEINKAYPDECPPNCLLLKNDEECTLFNEELSETILQPPMVWQDGATPTRQRCLQCKMLEDKYNIKED